MDIEARPDASNKHGIGWIRETEWLIYTVEVKEAGEYVLEIPVASNKPGGTFHIQFDGVDVTGPITIPDTGGWDKLETLKVEGVTLKAGVQRMKLMMEKDGESGGIGDIDLVRFKKAELPSSPPPRHPARGNRFRPIGHSGIRITRAVPPAMGHRPVIRPLELRHPLVR